MPTDNTSMMNETWICAFCGNATRMCERRGGG
jgi:hypothetical protein